MRNTIPALKAAFDFRIDRLFPTNKIILTIKHNAIDTNDPVTIRNSICTSLNTPNTISPPPTRYTLILTRYVHYHHYLPCPYNSSNQSSKFF